MASWNIPALVNKIAEDIPAIKGLLTALFKWTDADTTDVPTGAKRLQSVTGGRQIQEYSGSAWASVGKLMHDCDMLDGKHASTSQTANTIPVRDANGTIPGNVSGNAATATTASSLASDYTVPIANGGTGATTAANARSALGANNASNISSGILGVAYGGTGSSTKNFVDLTNNQNVGGTKTFSTSFTTSASPMLTSTNWSGIANADTTRGQASYKMLAQVLDKDGKRFVGIEATAATDGSRSVNYTMRNRANSGYITGFTLKELADGTIQQLVQTPAAAANDTQAASTAWVRTYCETTKKFLTSHQSLANYLTKTTNVSEMGRYIDMHYDNATSKYDHDVRFQVNSQGTAAGGGVLQIVAASVKASKFEGPLTGNVTGNCSGSSGSCTGNAATATKATGDSAGNNINKTYIKALSVSGKTITYTKGDGTTGTITTQDTNTTYSNFVKSGSSAAAGLVPKPSTTAGTTKYLREDCSWQVPPNTTYSNFVKSGSSAAAGLVPKPSTTAGTTKYLREDCSWQVPPNTNTTYSNFTAATSSAAGKAGLVPAPPKYISTYNADLIYLSNNGWKYSSNLYGSNPASDRRSKQDFTIVPSVLLDAWNDIEWCQFRFIKDVKKLQNKALINTGLVVQDIHETFKKYNIDYSIYELTSHDLHEAEDAQYDEDGNLIYDAQPAVDEWHLNYIQALSIEAAYQRRRASRAEARIAVLEERLANIESKLN